MRVTLPLTRVASLSRTFSYMCDFFVMKRRVRPAPPELRGRKTRWYNLLVVRTRSAEQRERRRDVMRENIEEYARTLEGLSLEELSRGAEKLVSLQRRNDAALIAHLVEISRRKGHLELGFSSLFEYCQECLRLGDGGAVWRRTQVAGVARRFPRLLEDLDRGRVNLSVLAILAAHLSEENIDELLEEVEGKTTREVKEIVAGISPKPEVKSGVRRKPVRRRGDESREVEGESVATSPPPEEEEEEEEKAEEDARDATERTPETEQQLRGTVEVARPEVYNFRFSAGTEFREKLERLGEVLGIADAAGNMPEVLEQAIDLALEKKDPKRKLERRRKREAAARRRASPAAGGTGKAGVRGETSSPPPEEVTTERERAGGGSRGRSRYVTSAFRERAFERAGYQCEFRGATGVRCTARTWLEVDHIEPFGKGGSLGEENLRVLCRAHNVLAAEREFGAEFMRGKIEGRKAALVKDTG